MDDRDNVLKALEEHRLTSLVDHVVAGDDMVTPKPHRDNAHVICSTLNVKPTSVSALGGTRGRSCVPQEWSRSTSAPPFKLVPHLPSPPLYSP